MIAVLGESGGDIARSDICGMPETAKLIPGNGMYIQSFSIKAALILLVTLPFSAAFADTYGPDAGGSVAGIFQPFQQLLQRHVTEHRLSSGGLLSSFDYRSALDDAGASGLLEAQHARLAEFDPQRIGSRAGALAFWINAYNYFMIAWILENPQDGALVESVRDYGHFLNPYRVFQRDLFDIGGQKYSLSGIELEILLGDEFRERGWWDARVHFMVNCASLGCPPLRRQVYTAANVEQFMLDNTRAALDTPLHLQQHGDTLRLTSLFDWYQQDFVDQSGSVEQFIREFGSREAVDKLESTSNLEFIDYDWALNSPENFRSLLRRDVQP